MFRKQLKFFILLTFIYACTPDLPIVPPINPVQINEFHPGKFVWRDLMSENIPAVKKFYSELFGWTYVDVNDEEQNYTVVIHNGKPIAGIFKLRDVKSDKKYSQWISYVSVTDMNKAIQFTKKNGGTIYREPFDLPNRGNVAFILDNQNAVLAFVKSSSGDPKDTEPIYNEWLWSELWTDSIDESRNFYSDLFGYDLRKFSTSADNYYYVFQKENKPRAGMVNISFENVKPHWMPYIAVKDPSEIVKKVEQLGGTIYLGTEGVIGNNAAVIADPSGAVFTVQKWPLEKGKLNEVKDE